MLEAQCGDEDDNDDDDDGEGGEVLGAVGGVEDQADEEEEKKHAAVDEVQERDRKRKRRADAAEKRLRNMTPEQKLNSQLKKDRDVKGLARALERDRKHTIVVEDVPMLPSDEDYLNMDHGNDDPEIQKEAALMKKEKEERDKQHATNEAFLDAQNALKLATIAKDKSQVKKGGLLGMVFGR